VIIRDDAPARDQKISTSTAAAGVDPEAAGQTADSC
jgi:hypothetical protein